jgi:hypothetical protein
MATWIPTENEIGIQPIATTSTTANHALGKVIRAKDNDTTGQGAAEFIYLLGVANTVVGSAVTYNTSTFQTAIALGTANQGGAVAFAMSANVAAGYGWYQIGGSAVVKKTAVIVSAAKKVYLVSSTVTGNGRISAASVTGKQILGARSANLTAIASATSTVLVMLDRPHLAAI